MSPKPIARGIALVAATALLLSACAEDDTAATSPESSSETSQGSDDTQGTEGAQAILDEYDIEGESAVEVIDYMDRLGGDERPADLMASVRADELVLTSGDQEETMPIPEDRFYLSLAPYVEDTHECFYHSLTTCQGELVEEEVKVTVVDETNDEVLLDESVTTFENGFYGMWVPRDVEGTISVEYGDVSGEMPFTTDDEAPTCVTTLQLS